MKVYQITLKTLEPNKELLQGSASLSLFNVSTAVIFRKAKNYDELIDKLTNEFSGEILLWDIKVIEEM